MGSCSPDIAENFARELPRSWFQFSSFIFLSELNRMLLSFLITTPAVLGCDRAIYVP